MKGDYSLLYLQIGLISITMETNEEYNNYFLILGMDSWVNCMYITCDYMYSDI